jgi:leucyl-tRNA synthetase
MTTERYNAREAEPRWQRVWEQRGIFNTKNEDPRPKYYMLEMFPYPSGRIHIGHVRNYMIGVFVLQNSDRGSIIRQLRMLDLHGLPENYLANYVQLVNAVTPEAVSAMARKYLGEDVMTLVIVGDLATVRRQLAGLDWVREGDLE